jgi:hypothetical protein
MHQLDFLGPNLGVLESALRPTAAPHNGTDTSAAMARKVMRRGKSAADEALLLAWLEQRGALGATDEEIRERFVWSGDYERPRRWALEQDGLVVDSKAARRNAKGNLMTVWVSRRGLNHESTRMNTNAEVPNA